jgi:hypothetical protein
VRDASLSLGRTKRMLGRTKKDAREDKKVGSAGRRRGLF